jgi:hypothetical protein
MARRRSVLTIEGNPLTPIVLVGPGTVEFTRDSSATYTGFRSRTPPTFALHDIVATRM